MRYLVCPDQIEIALTNIIGDPMKVRREGDDGRIRVESMLANWWDFIVAAASQDKFFDKISSQLEAIELGVNFRKTIFEARAAKAKVIALEDDVAKRLKAEVLARVYDRNTQHCYYEWIKLVDGISEKDPRPALAVAQEN